MYRIPFSTINEFVKTNIQLRIDELSSINKKNYHINERCVELLNLIDVYLTSPESYFNILDIMDEDILCRISSKSILQIPSNSQDKTITNIITNRLRGLDLMLNGINFKTGVTYCGFLNISKYRYFIVAFYIVAGQVFTDCNHRVCNEYLCSCGIPKEKANKIIKAIDVCRNNKSVGWDNLHKCVEKIISKLNRMSEEEINEIISNEKIENIYI